VRKEDLEELHTNLPMCQCANEGFLEEVVVAMMLIRFRNDAY
jgi:hypothetical protein